MNNKLQSAKEQLMACARPIFLFDDDPDGLAAFLILYKMVHAGKGIPLKGNALNEEFSEKVNNYQPDLVVILDKHDVDQDFIDKIRAKIIWIDHHEPKNPKGVLYINPRKEKENLNISTSQLAYMISEEDEWIAVTGIVSDWMLPDKKLWDKFNEKHPNLLPLDTQDAPTALFNTQVGKLARIFSFNLKGKISDVTTSMKILTRIKDPEELLQRTHSQARLIMKKYDQHNSNYEEILESVTVDKKDPLILFTYNDHRNSYTTDLSNELLYKYPEKVIIIGRETNGSYKCSLRAAKIRIDQILEKIISQIGGEGGGHEHACGAVIPSESFETFINMLRDEAKQ